MISLSKKPGPSGSDGSALLEQLTGSLYVAELERQLTAAKTERELEVVARAMDRPAFEALPPDSRLEIATFYAHRLYVITGALLG